MGMTNLLKLLNVDIELASELGFSVCEAFNLVPKAGRVSCFGTRQSLGSIGQQCLILQILIPAAQSTHERKLSELVLIAETLEFC